jgi:pullulanase
MYQLALGIVLTSQGISFLHSGAEFYRTKQGVENSFESPDSINAIDWGLASSHAGMVKYLQQLIVLRKAHPAFRLTSASLISESIRFEPNTPEGVVAYTIDGSKVGDTWKKILVVYHGGTTQTVMAAPAGSWNSAIRNNSFSKGKAGKQLTLAPSSLSVFYIAQ